jgi:hypothetical protein
MYKLGVCTSGDLDRTTTLLGKQRQVAFSLLRTSYPASAADIARFERVIRSTAISSGVSRTTYWSRFDDLDAITQRVLQRTFSADQCFDIHDIGASDGVLSMQWAERVFAAFPLARMTASDISLYFTEAVWVRSGETYILEPDGTPIQYAKAPFVVSLPRREHPAYLLNALVRGWASWRLRKLRLCNESVSWRGVPDSTVITSRGWRFRQIPLVHPAVLSFACNGRFRVVEANAFYPLPSQCHVIRAMNLYQTAIFTSAKILQGIRAALDSIVDGGIFIAGKTIEMEGARNDVSIFQKSQGRVRVVEKLGKGFELERHVLDMSL